MCYALVASTPARYSNPYEDLQQKYISEAEGEATAARNDIASGAKTRLTIRQAEDVVRQGLKDPESARFRDVRRNTATGAVCGYVNAKNSYGGYVGETPFIYYPSAKYSSPQLLFSKDTAATATMPYVTAFCPLDATTVSTDAPIKRIKSN